jgi:hypothetical protein
MLVPLSVTQWPKAEPGEMVEQVRPETMALQVVPVAQVVPALPVVLRGMFR